MREISFHTAFPVTRKTVLTTKAVKAKGSFELSLSKITLILTGITLLLTLLSVAGHALQFIYGSEQFVEYVRLFNLSGEKNIPTWFSSTISWIAAALLAYIALLNRKRALPYARHWFALAFIFLFISVSTTATIHDWTLEIFLVETFELHGIFYFPWVIPAWLFVLLVGRLYFHFLADLPAVIRRLFLLSGAVYVSGALVLEMLSAYLMDYYAGTTLLRGMAATGQEFLEMMGLVLFIHALFIYITRYTPAITLRLGNDQPGASMPE
jgi:hypothetical protein